MEGVAKELRIRPAGSNGQIYAPLSVCSADALKRLTISSARMRLSLEVEDVDVQNALSILKASITTWHKK